MATSTSRPADSAVKPPPPLLGVHHLKLAAHDIQMTCAFYTDVFSFTPLPQLDHRDRQGKLYGTVLQLPGEGKRLMVEVRHHPAHAAAQAGWDPVTWRVAKRADLDEWATALDARQIEHSRVLKGALGWVLAVRDPDGRFVRLYTDETHEWTADIDEGEWPVYHRRARVEAPYMIDAECSTVCPTLPTCLPSCAAVRGCEAD